MGKKKRQNKLPPFVAIFKAMIKSDAYKSLSNASRVAYLLLKNQIKHKDQREVIFPYSHAEEYMTRRAFCNAINQLSEKGFIEITQKGGLYRRTNVYRFVNGWSPLIRDQHMENIEGGAETTPSKRRKIAQQGAETTPSGRAACV